MTLKRDEFVSMLFNPDIEDADKMKKNPKICFTTGITDYNVLSVYTDKKGDIWIDLWVGV